MAALSVFGSGYRAILIIPDAAEARDGDEIRHRGDLERLAPGLLLGYLASVGSRDLLLDRSHKRPRLWAGASSQARTLVATLPNTSFGLTLATVLSAFFLGQAGPTCHGSFSHRSDRW